ncbi:MAG: hypothetical protein KJP23_21980, partial [Deltaproteobacteria bacterium]|nr:hypothetical protein [Deltaproteobacteria bacterium]
MKSAFRRVYKGFIAITVIAVILLATLYLFRSTLVAPYIQRFMEDSIESQLGIRLKVAAVGGSYFRDLVVTNVTTVKPAPGGPLIALELKRLRVAYNLLSLFEGIDAFLAAAAIELDGASLKIDLSPRREISQVRPKSDLASPFFMPDRLPRLRIRDTSVLLLGAGYATDFIGIELKTVDARPTTSTLQLGILQWSWNHPDLQDGQTPVSAVIEYSRNHIAIKNLTLAEQQIAESVQVGLKALPESLTFDANLSLAGGQAALDGKLDHADLVARLDVEHVDLARLISILKAPGPRLTGMLSLKADLGLPIQQPSELTADLDLKLTGSNLYGLAADELVLKARAKDGKMHLDRLDLRTGENLIEFQNVSSASQAVFGGDVEAILQTLTGVFAFDCRDVPAFFSLAGVDLSSEIDTVPAHRLMLDGEIGGGDIIISGGSLTTGSGHIRLDPSRIALPSMNRPIRDTAIQAALDIDLPDLELIGRLFKIPQLGGSVQGHATASGTFGAPGGTATVTARGIAFKDVTYGDLTVKASADSQAATIESLTLLRGKDRLSGRGRFHFVNQAFENVQLEFQLSDLAFYTAKF